MDTFKCVCMVAILETKFKDLRLIAVLTDPEVGGTFLTWSIHYLRGDTCYFLAEHNKYCKIPKNPLSAKNAHNFIPNNPNRGVDRGMEKFYHIVDKLVENDNQGIIYLHDFDDNKKDTAVATEYVSNYIEKKILVSTKNLPRCRIAYSSRGAQWISSDELITDPDKIFDFFVKKYFEESHKIWMNQKLNEIWDKREFIALNFNFNFNKKSHTIEDCFDCSVDHYKLNVTELYNIESYVHSLFDYLELPIHQSRLKLWQGVYRNWQQFHKSRLLFSWYFDDIINYIINGHKLDLTRFNLDIVQEACIQSHLIYNHNLNLKTWQLEKFTDTRQLHNLLETNFHNIKP